MPATRELRRRIKSVRSTRQITKAMELVSASKMRRATEAAVISRPYREKLLQIVATVLAKQGGLIRHPLLKARPVRQALVIAIASDRGLAGAYNAAVVRQCLALAAKNQENGIATSFITLGRTAERSLLRLGCRVIQAYPGPQARPGTAELQPVIATAVDAFANGSIDEVSLAYTEFHSALSQEAKTVPLLPLTAPTLPPLAGDILFEPSPEEVLNELLPRVAETELYQAVLEALASEHSARRIAMKNATDNASDMIEDLTLTYNGVRQSAITQEIAEITSGSAALTH